MEYVGGVCRVVVSDRGVIMSLDQLQPFNQRPFVGRQHRRQVEVPKYLKAGILQTSVYTVNTQYNSI